MATLEEQFDQAAQAARRRKDAPPHAQANASLARLDELHRRATEGPPEEREDAMRHYIELVGDLGQQDG